MHGLMSDPPLLRQTAANGPALLAYLVAPGLESSLQGLFRLDAFVNNTNHAHSPFRKRRQVSCAVVDSSHGSHSLQRSNDRGIAPRHGAVLGTKSASSCRSSQSREYDPRGDTAQTRSRARAHMALMPRGIVCLECAKFQFHVAAYLSVIFGTVCTLHCAKTPPGLPWASREGNNG